jgi:hypothetical protein
MKIKKINTTEKISHYGHTIMATYNELLHAFGEPTGYIECDNETAYWDFEIQGPDEPFVISLYGSTCQKDQIREWRINSANSYQGIEGSIAIADELKKILSL